MKNTNRLLLLLSTFSSFFSIVSPSQIVLAQSQDPEKMPIIIDDDGSPDGMIAVPYILQNNGKLRQLRLFNLKQLITIPSTTTSL